MWWSKRVCGKARITGNSFINHSFCAYGATTFFQAGVQCTGHWSFDSLRHYEQTSETQLVDISNIMSGGMSTEQVAGSTLTVAALSSNPKPSKTPPTI